MEDLLDTAGVAELLGIKTSTVRWYHKHRNRRQPPFPVPERYFGQSPAWSRQAILDWSASRPQYTSNQ